LQSWRNDYGKLLGHYQTLARALDPLGTRAPEDLARRTIRAVDRWRAHDPDDGQKANACQRAARILDALGMEDLAWEYRTTAVGSHPGEYGPWLNLAHSLSREGKQGLATRAYEAAGEAESKNAIIVWEQARHFREIGQEEQAERLLKRLAHEQWPDDYRSIGLRARWLLDE
jgi:Tfp pilus assembly protein PilF